MKFDITIQADSEVRPMSISDGVKKNFMFGSLGRMSFIGSMRIYMDEGNEIINLQIGNYCSLGNRIYSLFNLNHDIERISSSFHLGKRDDFKRKGQIVIGHDVWIGNRVTLLSGVRIGNGAVIGSGTVVSKDVPPYAVAVGSPMQIIKYRFPLEQIKALQAIQYWHWEHEKLQASETDFGTDIDGFISKYGVPEPHPEPLKIQARSTCILLYPDFEDPYPVWPKLIREYLQRFNADSDVTLVLRVIRDRFFDRKMKQLQQVIPDSGEFADITLISDELPDEHRLFASCRYYLATRMMHTEAHLEIADFTGVRVLSGVDEPALDQVTL